MRAIEVSDATYAAIWARWKEGDDGEDGILRREFDVATKRAEPVKLNSNGDQRGYVDSRYGVEFPKGFKIFRVYKGQHRWAVAERNGWLSDNNRLVKSLNDLSRWIGAKTENAWLGWMYQDGDRVRPIADLRDPTKIRRRGTG